MCDFSLHLETNIFKYLLEFLCNLMCPMTIQTFFAHLNHLFLWLIDREIYFFLNIDVYKNYSTLSLLRIKVRDNTFRIPIWGLYRLSSYDC